MSVSDVLSRISEIQTTIAQIQTGSPATSTDTSSATDAATAADFASALAAAGTDSSSTDGTTDGSSSLSTLLSSLQGAGTTSASGDAIDTSAATASASSPTGGIVKNGVTGTDVLADAKKYLGVPYVFGGTTTSGMDCSGLVQTVFKDLGVTMPRVVPDQAKMGVAVPSLADAKPGDLIVEKGNGHIQIYAGNGMILEAPKPGEDVKLRKEWLSADQIGTIRRIVPSALSSASSASLGSSLSGATSQSDLVTAALQQLMSSGVSA